MNLRRTLTFAALGLAVAGGAQAQTASENRDADALAADMRILAANPLDIEALIVAGELTLRMGDSTAAATFFGRAEKLDPNNPRIKAGWGSLMVRAERPGMALVRFQEAERRGLNPNKFAADRGLAYDLIGEQDRAQRDYRLALRSGPDDEVTRRYALSLGISGRREEALQLLDPLIQRSDRAAWRDRAFVLAMNGDTSGAEKIAATMMSPGLGAGLTPFFRKLPQLSAADRAFAVNFGEMRTSPDRVADAQLVPPLPRLGPDPYAPKVEVAAILPAATRPNDDGRKRKKRKNDEPAPATRPPVAAPVEVAVAPPVYVPPRVAPTPTPAARRAPAPVPPPVRVAAAIPQPVPAPVPTPAPAPAIALSSSEPIPAPKPAPAPTTLAATPAPTSPSATAPATPATNAAPTAPIEVAASSAVAPPVDPVPGTADQPSAAEAGVPEPTAMSRVSEDTVLARIVAGLDKPSSKPRRAPVATAPAPAEARTKPVEEPKPAVAHTRGKPTRDEIADSGTGSTKGRDKLADARDARGRLIQATDDEPVLDKNGCPLPPKATRGRASLSAKTRMTSREKANDARCKALTAKDDEPALDKNGCPMAPKGAKGKAAAPAKRQSAMTAREKANDARCKAATAKAKADAETKGEPARVWVQVAGGANEGDLRKAWAALQAKAPDLFRGRQGWSTPLRATNRVLTGPFASADDAQAFVNRMGKAGLSGFVFTSAKGQKIDRLASK